MVIDFFLLFKNDVFFSTRAKIIASQLVLVAFIVGVTAYFSEYAKDTIQFGLVELVTNALKTGDTSSAAFMEATRAIHNAQIGLFVALVLLSLLVALMTTRIALAPVADALTSQKRFIESISHELRTSLAILKTQNEVAKLDETLCDEMNEILSQNVQEIDHISEILNNLLLFSRVDTVQNIAFGLVDLTLVIDTVVSRLQRLAHHRGIKIIFEKSEIPLVYGNETGLEQMLFNLVKNGVTYSLAGGTVTISFTQVTDYDVTLVVSDTGIGIEQSELPHIFKLFYRTDTVQNKTSGTGLGLALVNEIIKLHNGKIKVESIVGLGTQFTVTIPRQPVKIKLS